MHTTLRKYRGWFLVLVGVLLLIPAVPTEAAIKGITGTTFNLRAKSGYISTADGSSVFFWGYANDNGSIGVQYPGPTLIVNQGDNVTITLKNNLDEATSIVFPGLDVSATGGAPGLLTREAPPDRLSAVTYTFTASQPGTYTYYSGTHTDLQVEMGMLGAIIVRPTGFDVSDPAKRTAYGDARSAYAHEYLFLLTEMDPIVHDLVEFGNKDQVNTSAFWPVLWFINGRNGPDTMGSNCDSTLPTQPYNIMPRINPGERLLLRFIGGGRDLHPFHTHGNNFDLIARDGRLLESAAAVPSKSAEVGVIPDLAVSDFTQTVAPGATYDALFAWTGRELGWDFYGHSLSDIAHTIVANPVSGEIYAQSTLNGAILTAATALTLNNNSGFPTNHSFRAVISAAADGLLNQPGASREVVTMNWNSVNGNFDIVRGEEGSTAADWADASIVSMTDHGAPFPVTLPGIDVIAPGAAYSGSPYLGAAGFLPPGEGGNNANSGFFYMWHSHNEKEMVNFDIFPGGMMTMLIIEPPSVTIPTSAMGVCQ